MTKGINKIALASILIFGPLSGSAEVRPPNILESMVAAYAEGWTKQNIQQMADKMLINYNPQIFKSGITGRVVAIASFADSALKFLNAKNGQERVQAGSGTMTSGLSLYSATAGLAVALFQMAVNAGFAMEAAENYNQVNKINQEILSLQAKTQEIQLAAVTREAQMWEKWISSLKKQMDKLPLQYETIRVMCSLPKKPRLKDIEGCLDAQSKVLETNYLLLGLYEAFDYLPTEYIKEENIFNAESMFPSRESLLQATKDLRATLNGQKENLANYHVELSQLKKNGDAYGSPVMDKEKMEKMQTLKCEGIILDELAKLKNTIIQLQKSRSKKTEQEWRDQRLYLITMKMRHCDGLADLNEVKRIDDTVEGPLTINPLLEQK